MVVIRRNLMLSAFYQTNKEFLNVQLNNIVVEES